ncbi:hypothetical protein BX666DRAFT_786571 [Dichotomocladium elegans]|nr:hypothetical protein BX666DRAFT_786571 [Dichotomocladium elegans]
MNTPPPEENTAKPDPIPSVSTPATFRHQHEDEASFERISDILSNLIKEANEAVQGIERERGRLASHRRDSNMKTVRTLSKLPRPKRLSLPPPPSPRTPIEPLVESFKRLDSSMALVDSLSRDLAYTPSPRESASLTENQFNIILVVPLLHIPHALITSVFHAATPNLTSMIAWACLFALGSLIIPSNHAESQQQLQQQQEPSPPRPRRLTLPGSYFDQQQQQSQLRQIHPPATSNPPDEPKLTTTITTTTTTAAITTTTPSLPPLAPSSSTTLLNRTVMRKRRPIRRSVYRKRTSAIVSANVAPSSTPFSPTSSAVRQSLFINLGPKEQSKRGRRYSM